MDALLGLDDLPREHPARQYVDAAKRVWQRGSFESESEYGAAAQVLLDRATWANYPPEDIWDAFGGDGVSNLMRPRLRNTEQFFDTMAELRLCGQIRQRRQLRAEFDINNGRPDLYLLNEGNRVWIEVKHIRPDSKSRRLKRHIEKANKQLKRATSGTGSGAVHISFGGTRSYNAGCPEDIGNGLTDLRQRVLTREQYRSVAQVVLGWSEYAALKGSEGTTVLAARRLSRYVSHPAPRTESVFPETLLRQSFVPAVALGVRSTLLNASTHGSFARDDSLAPYLRAYNIEWRQLAASLAETRRYERFGIGSHSAVLLVSNVRFGWTTYQMLTGGLDNEGTVEVQWSYLIPRGTRTYEKVRDEENASVVVLFAFVGEFGLTQALTEQASPLLPIITRAEVDEHGGLAADCPDHDVTCVADRSWGPAGIEQHDRQTILFHHLLDWDKYMAQVRRDIAPTPRR